MGQDETGARSFIKWLADLGDGITARDLSEDLRRLERELHSQAIDQGVTVKGELAIKFKFKTDRHGVCTIDVEPKVTLPKKPTASGIMWHDPKTGHLGATNPKQMTLGGLREVVGGKRARDEDDGEAGSGTH